MPYLFGAEESPPHEILFWRMFDRLAVRRGDWKLVRMEGGVEELYNLTDDLGETTDLSKQRPEVLKELTRAFDEWSAEMAEPMWSYPTRAEMNKYRRSRARRP